MNYAKSQSMITDFTKGSISKHLIVFATPLFLSSLMQILYNMADMIIVGHVLGKAGISAISVGGDITGFLTFFVMGFANAGQVIISQYIGSSKKDELGKFISTMFSSLMISAVILSVLCLFITKPVLNLMNTPKESYKGAYEYCIVCISGLIFIYGYNIVSAILRGMGDSRHPFVFIAIASVLNIILDIILVIFFDMGCMGAAFATVVSQGVSFLLCLGFLYRKRESLGFDIKPSELGRINLKMLSALLKLGFPMAIKSASIHFSKMFVNSWINSYGVAVSAFAGIANKVNSFSNLISNSVNTAGSSMVGQNIGAGKYERVPRIAGVISIFTFSVAIFLSLLFIFFPDLVYSIFTTDLQVLKIAREFIPIAVILFFGSACRAPANAILNGSGNYRINFVTAILDGIVLRIGLSVLFGILLDMRYMGFWLGDALAGFTPMFIGIVFYVSGRWKKSMI